MAGFEQTIIIGRAGRDPDLKYMQSGDAVCNFSVAVSKQWTDRQTGEKRESTNWYSVSAFKGTAETIAKYVTKGSPIMIEGTVTARAYMGSDGEPRASLDLRVNKFQLLGSRGDSQSSDSGSEYDEPESIPF